MDAKFRADPDKCIGCGQCVRECVAGIVGLEDGLARVAPADMDGCIGCQHCLAVCPTAAVSVLGLNPADSVGLAGFTPDAGNLELLVKGRRSVRQFRPEPVPKELLEKILKATAYAPTGVNARSRRFIAIRDEALLHEFRDRVCKKLAASRDRFPEEAAWLVEAAEDFLNSGDDMIFRSAPHLLVATVEKDAPCADVDPVIALSYFDLIAQANGVGTVWAGMIANILRHIPECRAWLGIPESHAVGYAILFGMRGVSYPRAAQYEAEDAVFLSKLEK